MHFFGPDSPKSDGIRVFVSPGESGAVFIASSLFAIGLRGQREGCWFRPVLSSICFSHPGRRRKRSKGWMALFIVTGPQASRCDDLGCRHYAAAARRCCVFGIF